MKPARGTLCPVCIRPARADACADHGPWRPHQLLTAADRRRCAREQWHPYEAAPHACPRCLGDVAEVGGSFVCIEHDHGAAAHGPYQVDELLGMTAQRESALARSRLARRYRAQSAPVLRFDLPDPARTTRIAVAAAVIAGTLAYLVR